MGRLLEQTIGRWRRVQPAPTDQAETSVFASFLARAKPSRAAAATAGASTASWRSGFPTRWYVVLIALPALAVAGYLALSRADDALRLRPVQSVLAMLDLRSPGERAAGNLIDSKPVLAGGSPAARTPVTPAAPPQQRALGKIFPPADLAPAGDGIVFSPPFQPGTLAFIGPDIPAPGGPVGAAPAGGGGVDGGPGGGGGGGGLPGGGGGGGAVPGGPGGGGGGLGGGENEGGPGEGLNPGSPPVAAVPEPGTWLMMIVAFGLCGTMLRRQRRANAGALSCKPAS